MESDIRTCQIEAPVPQCAPKSDFLNPEPALACISHRIRAIESRARCSWAKSATNLLPHPSRFCEGWDTTNLDTDRRVSHPLQRAQRTPDSCHAALDKTACAPFSKERRMKYAEPTKLNRNPGGGAPAHSWCFLPCKTPGNSGVAERPALSTSRNARLPLSESNYPG